MGDANSDSQSKLWFPARLRELRIARNLKQREVAAAAGMAESSYANAESANHKRIRLDRVVKLAEFYGLDDPARLALIAGWEALPESAYNRNMAKPWAERDARRAKLKAHDALKLSLIETLNRLIEVSAAPAVDPATLCTCAAGEADFLTEQQDSVSCELCDALRLAGVPGWSSKESVIAQLAAAQEKMAK